MNADNDAEHLVVINDEEQYSIWPVKKAIPDGWRSTDRRGTKEYCLSYIKEVWTDMRPKSLRDALARVAENRS
ncbi:MbtH family protein [Sorangium sp. So ce131]|uniref:MbtH family protein n=1 Tax=Sorangium sp. So ce131 TaxID=3133282 RepID=UPI003F601DB4